MKKKSWTPKDDLELDELLRSGMKHADIAERIGRTHRATYARIRRISDVGLDIDNAPAPLVSRGCLKCGKKFMSEHVGNRVCGKCQESRSWLAGIS
jgi:ribosomal protein S27AE